MNLSSAAPEVSVVVEWENAVLAELEVSSKMLRALARECARSSNVTEVRFVFNPEIVDEVELCDLVAREFLCDAHLQTRLSVVFQSEKGLHYYQIKNAGAKASTKDIVVFCDSDVIPDQNWLPQIIQPLLEQNEGVAVAGASHIAADNLVATAFAAGWFFPMESDIVQVPFARYFYANNVAFRRKEFVARLFPEMPEGVTRGACVKLANALASDNQKIIYRPKAVVRHPAPNGLLHFFIRGLAEGRDLIFMRDALSVRQKFGLLARSMLQIATIGPTVRNRIVFNQSYLGKHARHPILAGLVMTIYQTLIASGVAISIVAPNYTKKVWKI